MADYPASGPAPLPPEPGPQADLFQQPPPLSVMRMGPTSQGGHIYQHLLNCHPEELDIGTMLDPEKGGVKSTNHRARIVKMNTRLKAPAVVEVYGPWKIENNGASGWASAYHFTQVVDT